MEKKYYDILDVDQNASQDEIKKAFRKKAHAHHPDKGGDEKQFKEINTAYQVLSDEQKRKQYDQFGAAGNQFGGYSSADFYSQFSRTGFGQRYEMPSLKKVPLITWIILLPFLLLVALIGIIFLIGIVIRSIIIVARR